MALLIALVAVPAVQVWLALAGLLIAATVAHDWHAGRELRAINRRYRAKLKAARKAARC